MKNFLAILIVISGLSACTHNVFSKQSYGFTPAENNVVAHRGAWKAKSLPENSLASLREAIHLGVTGSEFDVRMTSDGVLVINHDADYHNMLVEKTTFAALRKINLENGELLPTLEMYITEGLKNNTTTALVCEIKPSSISKERGQIIAEKTYNLINKLGAQSRTMYISFDYMMLTKLRALDKDVLTFYLDGSKSPQQLKEDGVSGLDYLLQKIERKPEWIKEAKENYILLNAWTANDSATIDWLNANSFQYITTNEPELALKMYQTSTTTKGYSLAWSEEFNYTGMPDTSIWSYTIGGKGYGNNELQYYTDGEKENVFVKEGKLHITALKKNKEDNNYTSARLNSQGKAEHKYGLIEISAKLPAGKGLWPAIWMLGSNRKEAGWPQCGEIDIMEHVGYQADSIYGTIHSTAYNHMKNTQKGKSIFIADPYTKFHKYSVNWTPEFINFMVDDVVYNHIPNEKISTKEWPFDQPFYFILNLAVGGNWGGKFGVDDSVFPATMEVEYVRVFEKKEKELPKMIYRGGK